MDTPYNIENQNVLLLHKMESIGLVSDMEKTDKKNL